MNVLVDADSLVYAAAYGSENIEDARTAFDMYMHNIYAETLERFGHVEEFTVYHGAEGRNFRKDINPDYKANRKHDRPELYEPLSAYVSWAYDAKMAPMGTEVDDIIADDWRGMRRKGEPVCIASIDKDYLQLPAIIYSWGGKRKGWTEVSEEEAIRNFYTQMIVGDSADNVNYIKGKGVKYAEKLLEGAQGEFSHLRRVYAVYKEFFPENARERFTECFKLLKIGQQE